MGTSFVPLTSEQIAKRVARDLTRPQYVNLGIGLPNLVAHFVDPGAGVVIHSENGVLGLGPPPEPGFENPDLIDAGKNLTTILPGASFFDQSQSFAMVRGGHVNIAILGAYEVSGSGDIANWSTNDPHNPPGVGGAMDLAVGAKTILVMMKHLSTKGEPKIVAHCTLPLTAVGVVSRIYTDLAVIDVTNEGLVVLEVIAGMTRVELQRRTGAPLRWHDPTGELSVLE